MSENDCMHVAIDARLLAYQAAGTATYIRGVVRGLQAARAVDRLTLVTSRQKSLGPELPTGDRFVSWTPCHHRWERWALGVELARLRADVLHSPDFIPPARLGRRWARVITVHDLAYLLYPELVTSNSRDYYGQIFRAAAEAERIIAVSERTRQDFLKLVDSSAAPRIAVIPEGVDDDFAPTDREEAMRFVRAQFGIDRPFFLFVGTLEPRKNLRRLLAAFRAFRERSGNPKVELVLAGARGWLSDDLDSLMEPLFGSVRIVGRVDREELIQLYNAAVALVLVSLYEGFGLPALEAMACGCAVLASTTGSLPEIVGDAGVHVDPSDEDAIAWSLEWLWSDEALRRDLAQRGRRRATAYSWLNVARQTAEVYEQAVACAS